MMYTGFFRALNSFNDVDDDEKVGGRGGGGRKVSQLSPLLGMPHGLAEKSAKLQTAILTCQLIDIQNAGCRY